MSLQLNNSEWYSRRYASISKNMYLDRMQEAGNNLAKLNKNSLNERQIAAMKKNQQIINNLKTN